MPRRLIQLLHPSDNVATALVALASGTLVEWDRPALDAAEPVNVAARNAIPFGHKIALAPIAQGQPVIKYGEAIGLATRPIAAGEHVHVHNVESQRGRGDLAPGRSDSFPAGDSRPSSPRA